MWVPLVENNEIESEGADYFVRKNIENILAKDTKMDTLILGCTHYPLLDKLIRKYVPPHIEILKQGHIVAEKLVDYLERHPEMEQRLSQGGKIVITSYSIHYTKLYDIPETYLVRPC